LLLEYRTSTDVVAYKTYQFDLKFMQLSKHSSKNSEVISLNQTKNIFGLVPTYYAVIRRQIPLTVNLTFDLWAQD